MARRLLLAIGLACLGRTDAFSAAGRSPAPVARLAALSAAASPRDGDRPLPRREFVARSIAAGIASSALCPAGSALADASDATIDPSVDLPAITQKVFLDVKFAKYKEPKRLVIGLFGDVMPRTVENFSKLSAGGDLSYDGTSFYRVISEMSIQGGAVGNASGKSGTSAFDGGKPFPPDNYKIRHTKAGLVSAVRNVDGTIDSRFFVQTEEDAGWADDRYAAFGIVLEEEGTGGMDLVRRISRVDVKAPQNSPKDPVTIVGCGVFEG